MYMFKPNSCCLEQATGSTGLNVNTNKTDYMQFKQEEAINLNGKHLKSVDWFTYLGSNISSTESNASIGKAQSANIRKSDFSDKPKQDFFKAVSVLLYGSITWDSNKTIGKKQDGKYTRMFWTNPGSSTHKTATVQPLTSYLTNPPS